MGVRGEGGEVNPVITVVDLSKMLNIAPEYLRALGKREDDPLPIRVLPGKKIGQFVVTEELVDWVKGNAPLIANPPMTR